MKRPQKNRPQRDGRNTREIHDLKSEIKKLKKEVSRLRRYIEKLEAEMDRDPQEEVEPAPVTKKPSPNACPKCQGEDHLALGLLDGSKRLICKTCKHAWKTSDT